MSAKTRNRQPAGVPVGGEYVREAGTSTGLDLGRPPQPLLELARDYPEDSDRLDELCIAMATNLDGRGDEMDAAASIVTESGRPAPGECDERYYRAALRRWQAEHPDTGETDYRALNAIALAMGEAEDWGDGVEDAISDALTATGRPLPGTIRGGEGQVYVRTIEHTRRAADANPTHPLGHVTIAAREAGLDEWGGTDGVASILRDHGVPDQTLRSLDADRIRELHTRHLAPAVQACADELARVHQHGNLEEQADLIDDPDPGATDVEDDDTGWALLRTGAERADLPVMGELLWSPISATSRARTGGYDYDADELQFATPTRLTQMFTQHIEPAIDAIGDELNTSRKGS